MASSDNFATIQSLLQATLQQSGLPQEAAENLKRLESLVVAEKQRATGVLSKFRLDNQVAIVTGGSRGIGYGLAQALGEAGCKVAIASINYDNAVKAAAELREKGIETLAIQVDVANKESVQAMTKKVLDTWGDLHIGVNNAGIADWQDGETYTEEGWDHLMGINLKGVFLCAQAQAQHMLTKGYGRIINMASMSGSIVNRPQNQAAYNASKAGVVHLTKSLAAEWASRGVIVNSISPGYIDSDMIKQPHMLESRKAWIKEVPLKRFGEIEDLTGLTILLAGALSGYMVGSDIIADGGYSLW